MSLLMCGQQDEGEITVGGGARAFVMLPEGGFCARVCDVNLNMNGVRVMFRFLVIGCYDSH